MLDLTRRADFALGMITVCPSSREVVGPGGPVMIEPKMMQVLVTLADAGGRVVSRDELIEKCWAGRVVGEDAINRVIGKLRRITESFDGAFRIETVARTGHRLLFNASMAGLPMVATSPKASAQRPWLKQLFAAAGAVAAAVLLLVFIARRDQVPSTNAANTPMPAAVTDLETRGLSAMFENTPEQTMEGVDYLRRATALTPRSAPVWGSLAMSYVLSLGWARPAERASIAARARDAASRGLALDPHESRSIAALVSLEPTFGHWAAKAAGLAAARARARPDAGPLAFQQVQFLMATGHNRAALAAIRPIVAGSPLVPWIQAAHINLLASTGQLGAADRAADAAGKIWPRDWLIWFTRFDLAMFNGQADRAMAMASDRGNWPKQTSGAEIQIAARIAKVIASRGKDDPGTLLRTMVGAAPNGQADAERAIRTAAALGRSDVAVAVARQLYLGRLQAAPRRTQLPNIGMPGDAEPPTAALFLSPGAALWTDQNMFALARELGLVAYWRRSGPPDLCMSIQMQGGCRAAGILN